MAIFNKPVYLLFIVLITGCNSTVNSYQSQNRNLSINNVNVVDVESMTINYRQNVCVVDGVITQVSTAPCQNENAKIIDGANGFLTPGLIDMHVHMLEKEGLAFALSHGVTHVRLMNGVSAQLKWRDDAETGKMLSSTATVSSPIISGYIGSVQHHGLSTAEEAIKAVTKYHAQGYDLIKAYNNLSEEAFIALMDESRKLAIPVAKDGSDVPPPLDISNFSDMQSYEHVENIFYIALDRKMNIEGLKPFIDKIKKMGVPITPTLNIFDQLTKLSIEKDDYLAQIPEYYISAIVKFEDKRNQVKRWLTTTEQQAEYNQQVMNFLLAITKALHEAEIPLLIGTDSGNLLSPHGLATHNEMRLFSKAGIDSFEILKAATYNAAKALKMDKKIGQIKVGFYADFIFSHGDPTTNLQQLEFPSAVSKRGVWLNTTALDGLRTEAQSSKSLWSELQIYLEMVMR